VAVAHRDRLSDDADLDRSAEAAALRFLRHDLSFGAVMCAEEEYWIAHAR
jgi:hypothetical protein